MCVSFIQVQNLKKNFGKVFALNGVSVNLEAGEQYAIQGSSGSGKSTLLYLLGGLDRPSEGTIEIAGRDLSKLNDEQMAKFRNSEVGFVFQFHFLLPSMNCLDNILLPAKIGGVSQANLKSEVENLAERLKVSHCLKKYPFELSGGEQQRVNIIRALSLKPKILLCDEPTGNLDSENSMNVAQILKTLALDFGSTLLVVTHDNIVAKEFDNQLFMKDGLMQDGLPALP
ncbi:MAG: lipoprotein-releasing system ATP-binding protein LolD [Halobacteriovorax sp.]|nr:lipoprotein-releasing system ATP-binding protein LolD [Halobacteriovorax sp.]